MANFLRLIVFFLFVFISSASFASVPKQTVYYLGGITSSLHNTPHSSSSSACSVALAWFNLQFTSDTQGSLTSCTETAGTVTRLGSLKYTFSIYSSMSCPENSTGTDSCTCSTGYDEKDGQCVKPKTDLDQCKDFNTYFDSTFGDQGSDRQLDGNVAWGGTPACHTPDDSMSPNKGCLVNFDKSLSSQDPETGKWTSSGTMTTISPPQVCSTAEPPEPEDPENCPPGWVNSGNGYCVPSSPPEPDKPDPPKPDPDKPNPPKPDPDKPDPGPGGGSGPGTPDPDKPDPGPGGGTGPGTPDPDKPDPGPGGGSGPGTPDPDKPDPGPGGGSGPGTPDPDKPDPGGGGGGGITPAPDPGGGGGDGGGAGPGTPGPGDGGGDGDCEGDDCGDGDKSSFGGSCLSSFKCEGDVLQCAIAKEQHIRNCKLFDDKSPESELYEKEKGKEGDQTKDLEGNETIDLNGRINTSDALGGGSGVSDLSITVWGHPVTLPLSDLNGPLAALGNLLVAVSFIIAVRIVGRG